jgi:adenylate kinase
MSKIIVFLGPPGSGKDTQSEIVQEKHGIPIVSTGFLIRGEIKNQTDIGKKIEKDIADGKFASDEIIKTILSKRLKIDDTKNGFILDGYPRNMQQAQYLDDKIRKEKKITVFYIKIEEDEISRRILNRRICSKCGTSFHLIFKKPKLDGICDICGGKLIKRKDDNEKSIKERIKFFNKRTQPLVEFYEKTNRLFSIDGKKSIEEISLFVEKNIR